MRIRSLVNAGAAVGSFTIGHEYDVSDEVAAEFIRIGYAVEVPVVLKLLDDVPVLTPITAAPAAAPAPTAAPKRQRARNPNAEAVTDAVE